MHSMFEQRHTHWEREREREREYSVVNDCKVENHEGASDASKVLLLMSLQNIFQSTNETQRQENWILLDDWASDLEEGKGLNDHFCDWV